jgi:hypothetical protein
MMNTRLARWASSTGLWIGAAAWAASTLLNYVLVSWVCSSRLQIIPVVAGALALVAILGGFVSWRAFVGRTQRIATATPGAGTPHEMLAVIGMASGLLFALIIAMQGSASFFLTGCEP